MIQQLKDKDGNYIPLDTLELYEDDGTVFDVTGFSYIPRLGIWVASTTDGKPYYPSEFHLNKPADDDDIDELFKALESIVDNDKFRNLLKNRFAELKERCK